MKNYIKLFIAGGISIVFALTFYYKTINMSESAAFLPRILIGLIILLSLGMMYEGYYKEKKNMKAKRRIDERSEEDEDKSEEETGVINIPRAIIFTVMIALYILLLKPVGYFVMTPIYIVSTYLFLKATKIKKMLFIAVGFTAFVYVVFVAFLKIPIPMGILQ